MERPANYLSRGETDFLRFLAILLITNSHLDRLYPLPQLATGGAIGNALFFALSGYGLFLSDQGERRSFFPWYWRRITRIYPSVYLVTCIDLAANRSWGRWRAVDYVAALTWPTLFWFVGAIMLFYAVFFFIMQVRSKNAFVFGIALLLVPYLYYYFSFMDLSSYTIEGPSYFKWIFYLQIMLFGGYLAAGRNRLPQGKVVHLLYLIAALALYFMVIMAVRAGLGKLQAFVHGLTFFIVYLVLSLSRSRFVRQYVLERNITNFIVSAIAALTLEIYLLQYMVYSNRLVVALPFPGNILVFFGIVVLLALGVAKAAIIMRSLLRPERRPAVLTR